MNLIRTIALFAVRFSSPSRSTEMTMNELDAPCAPLPLGSPSSRSRNEPRRRQP